MSLARKYNLPHPNPSALKIGHLREMLNDHFPQYLELWFLQRVKERIIPNVPGLLPPARNKSYIPGRSLEFDFSWKSIRLAVEIQGGIDSKGRKSGHVSAAGMRRDMEKINLAQINGWLLLQLAPEHIFDDEEWSSYTQPLLLSSIRLCQLCPRLTVPYMKEHDAQL